MFHVHCRVLLAFYTISVFVSRCAAFVFAPGPHLTSPLSHTPSPQATTQTFRRLANFTSRLFYCRYSVKKLSGETLDLRLLFFLSNCRNAVFFLDWSIFVLASLPGSRLTELSASVQHLALLDILRASSFRQSFLISIFYTASIGSEFHSFTRRLSHAYFLYLDAPFLLSLEDNRYRLPFWDANNIFKAAYCPFML